MALAANRLPLKGPFASATVAVGETAMMLTVRVAVAVDPSGKVVSTVSVSEFTRSGGVYT